MNEINEQQLMELLRARVVIQRRLRVELEKLETVENDLEQLLADAEGRQPLRKVVDVTIAGVN